MNATIKPDSITAHCPSCKKEIVNDVRMLYRGFANGFRSKEILYCQTCELNFMHPMPTANELSVYYGTYWGGSDIETRGKFFRAQAASRYKYISAYLPVNEEYSVLDVGAGFGLIKKFLPQTVIYDAIEVDPIAIDYLKSKIKPNNIYQDTARARGRYRLVVLSHILEHVTNPVDFLASFKELLTQDGVVFIEVPNQDFRYKLKDEPHLLFFSIDSLKYAVVAAGYKALCVDTCGRPIDNSIEKATKRTSILKKLAKKLVPASLVRKFRKRELVTVLNQYGGDRQWIRMVIVNT